MNQKEIKELIEFLIEKDIAEFELERGDVKLRINRAGKPGAPMMMSPAPIAPAPIQLTPVAAPMAVPAPAAAKKADAEEEGLYLVKSPIVGTYYESPSPGAPPFVKPGDTIKTGQALCIIEAMKLMNEIEAEVDGEVAKVLVKNGQAVEYGQALFAIRQK